MRTLKTRTTSPVAVSALVAAVMLAIPGCGDGRLSCQPVRGELFINGQPAHGAKVYFFPVDAPKDQRANCPIGQVDEAGQFALTTYIEGDGAPTGEYIVCFEWPNKHALKGTFEGSDRLEGKFYSKAESTHRVTVNAGVNEPPRFNLTSTNTKPKRDKDAGPLGGN